MSGSTTYPILGYGTVDVLFTTPTGQQMTIPLRHIALIPGFFTNLISFSRAKEAGIFWDTKKDTLYNKSLGGKENHFCLLHPHNRHWIVEYNDPPTTPTTYASSTSLNATSLPTHLRIKDGAPLPASSAASSEPKTIDISPTHLHQIMGHAGAEAIAKLPSAVTSLKLSSPCAKDEFRSCEACQLSKAHRIIVRSSDSEVPSTSPLQRIAYDLI